MRFGIGKRFLLVVHSLLSLAALAALVFSEQAERLTDIIREKLGANISYIVFIVAIAVYIILALAVLVIAFSRKKRRNERGFVLVDASDGSSTRVSITAIDQMVKQAASSVDGIAEMKTFISAGEDTVDLRMNVAIENGSHVPTVTLNLQNAIRKYIEVNCGVAVRSISVNIISMQNSDPYQAKKKPKNTEGVTGQRGFRLRNEKKQASQTDETIDRTDTVNVSPDPQPETVSEEEIPELVLPHLEITRGVEADPEESEPASVPEPIQSEGVSDFARRFDRTDAPSESEPETADE